jgi:cardiolipin synthase
LVRDAQEAVTQFWLRLKATRDARELDFASAWAALQSAMRLHHPLAARSGEKQGPGTRAALVLRDNFRNRTRIERAYRKAIGAARSEIIIANAYFVPGLRLRSALVHAARRGVRVRLLLQGKYEYFMQYHAARPVFGALLEAGVEIHEYSASFLHAKVAVVDARWATVGSSNLDPLSMLLAREANVVVDDAPFASELRRRLDVAMQTEGRQLDPSVYAHRPWSQRFMDGIAYWLMRGMLFLNGSRY